MCSSHVSRLTFLLFSIPVPHHVHCTLYSAHVVTAVSLDTLIVQCYLLSYCRLGQVPKGDL